MSDFYSFGARLAPHETLELHELLAYQSNCLSRFKKTVPKIADPELRHIYLQCISTIENSIGQLMGAVQRRPTAREGEY